MAKLDLMRAWDGAVRMLLGNRELAAILGGVFFFLPLLAAFFTWFGNGIDILPKSENPDPEQIARAIDLFLRDNWWVLLLVGLLQIAGSIALLRVLAAPSRPTVGDAMRHAATLMLPLIGAQLLSGIAVQILPTLQAALLGEGPASAMASLVIFPVAIYLSIKFSLISPVVAIDEVRNPVHALRRSWALTRGRSARLLGFYILLILAGVLVFLVAAIVMGLVFALLGEQGAVIGSALFLAASVTLALLLGYAVVASVHRQLAGGE